MTSTYDTLRAFLGSEMRMSHIYQPVMLEVLLTHRGAASVREIAAAILAHDESQLDYYEEIVKKMPGKVLSSHGIVSREKDAYRLSDDVMSLSEDESADLIARCRAAVEKFIELTHRAQDGLGFCQI